MKIKTCKVANYIEIKKLKFHPKNQELRQISLERMKDLKQSIIDKGFYEPILVWKKNATILAGNHRVKAVNELVDEGYEFETPGGKINHLPVVVEDCDGAMAYKILHESNNQYASWIEDRLSSALKEAEEAGENLRDYGYTTEEVDRLLQTALEEVEEDLTSEDDGEPNPHITPPREDRFEHLILPQEIYLELVDILKPIAKSLNDSWREGDSLTEAVQAMCQRIREKGIFDEKGKKIQPTKRIKKDENKKRIVRNN